MKPSKAQDVFCAQDSLEGQMAQQEPAGSQGPEAATNPGDDAPPGTPGTGEDVCPDCSGTGQKRDAECATCGGTGKVIKGIAGG
jgi:DnaJ-class molecular chaperone